MTPPPYSDPNGTVFIDTADAPEWVRVFPYLQFPVLNQAADDSTDADRLAVPDVIVPFHKTNTNENSGDNNDA